VITARIRLGEGSDELSPLVITALPIASVVCDLLKARTSPPARISPAPTPRSSPRARAAWPTYSTR
jgi:hypothetical protein